MSDNGLPARQCSIDIDMEQQRCTQPLCWQLLLLCYITLIQLCKSQIEEVLQVLDEELPGVSHLRPLNSRHHRHHLVPSCHRRLLNALQHQAADCLILLDPGVVVRLRPVLPEKVREGLQQHRSDEGVMLWPDPVGDMPLSQLLEHTAKHFRMLHMLDD